MLQIQRFVLLLGLIMLPMLVSGEGYEIRIKINGLTHQQIILGHYLSKSMYPDDTVKLDDKGVGTFKGPKKLPAGMYLVYLPNSRYFDLVVGEDQVFSVETDTLDFLNNMVIKGAEENQIFLDFQRYMADLKTEADSLTRQLRNAVNAGERQKLSDALKTLNENRIARIENIKKEYPGYFVADFLRATLDIQVPDPPKNDQGKIDSTWQYYYYRAHYFDNFDISDPRLLRTPFYEDKVMTYLNKVIPQVPDSLIPHVDMLIEKSRGDSALFRYMLITLFNHYGKSNIMGMDAVHVHIADKYYITESWWSDPKYLAELKDHTEKAKPLLIGAVAPDAELMFVPADHFKSAMTDTALRRFPHVGIKGNIRRVEAKFTVLMFWEAECGHCKTMVPELHNLYEKSLKQLGVQVLAISTLFGEDGKAKWVDFVNKNKLYGWINAWNPYSYDFKIKYDIIATPLIFILDENKKIIAKRISPDQVEGIITSILK